MNFDWIVFRGVVKSIPKLTAERREIPIIPVPVLEIVMGPSRAVVDQKGEKKAPIGVPTMRFFGTK
jgi:hypothetical protein